MRPYAQFRTILYVSKTSKLLTGTCCTPGAPTPNLLLFGFPAMALCLLFTGFSFYAPGIEEGSQARLGMVAAGIFMFYIMYLTGMCPFPIATRHLAYRD